MKFAKVSKMMKSLGCQIVEEIICMFSIAKLA